MEKLFIAFVGILLITGCSFTNYRVVVHNGTAEKIYGTKVSLQDGRSLRFGVMDPGVNGGTYPVRGPLGDVATVNWIDNAGITNDADTALSPGFRDDSVILLIQKDKTLTVQTGRGLYKPRLPMDLE
jgi:hypothetical protein